MNLRSEIEEHGFALRRAALDGGALATLRALLLPSADQSGARSRGAGMYAARNILWQCPKVAPALSRFGVDQIAAEAVGSVPFPINATYFNKNRDANWKVPPHQDLMMPMDRELDEPGFCGWSTKQGVVYVEPPESVLTTLIALRIHLDDCPATNGALSVVPGSHRRGKLRDRDIIAIAADQFTVCPAAAGDVMLMKPLLVHRSSPAITPSNRGILHIVYASREPGVNLRWKRTADPEL